MKIYVSHAKSFDYVSELYEPLKDSKLPVEFIFPHEEGSDPYDSKLLMERHGCDYVLAEVSLPATGQGIELGWADAYKMPIICFYKSGTTPAGSLKVITDRIIEYFDEKDFVNKVIMEFGLDPALCL